ncbi:hypothetical protein P5673_007916 [Acropora cervicornis]|uniref:Uncharacterized protein n=1 Tax=Acropora cervicornis TaxID=6130 RepID=A0AAD9VBM8_ACRCE|nr:hypothetical protein P5673_007916 [Acropora cervicornis]
MPVKRVALMVLATR